jgi:hypothetical protein
MSRFSLSKKRDPQGDPAVEEDPVLRQYRYLLRTAPVDALEGAHAEVIPLLSEGHQESLLNALRSSLLVGGHLTTRDHVKIAHLVTNGEHRAPGQLLAALPADVLQDLAERVLESESSFGLLDGYAGWDGAEPQPPDDSAWADGGFDRTPGLWDARNDPRAGQLNARAYIERAGRGSHPSLPRLGSPPTPAGRPAGQDNPKQKMRLMRHITHWRARD